MSFLSGPAKRSEGGGPATYRHLLSPQAMTVFNPLRVIAHCDIDAAYAQFEQVRLGLSDDVPLICAQWQSIIAVSYPARKYGIKRFNTIDEAKKMCPHLLVQHVATYRNGEAEAGYWGEVDPRTHKVSLDPYRRESLKILAIFKELVPRGELEKASIDEAFLDLSLLVIERLLVRFPFLNTVPPDAPEGIDSPLPPPPPVDWTKAGNVFPIEGDKAESSATTEPREERSENESDDGHSAEVTMNMSQDTWEDWALCMGAEIMAEIRQEVWKRLHYTCSAGIAHNKAMSKLCSAWKKPNNQTVLRMAATAAFLRDMDFTDIRYLGGKLGNAIANEFGAKTVGDMLTVPLEEMQNRFGEESIWVYNILRGVDNTEVKERVATKSMLASKNVRPHVTTPEQGLHWLNVLAGELHVRLRDSREISPGLWPKTLVLSHRTGIDPPRSRQTPFPFTRHLSTEYIVKYAGKLWEEATQPMNKGNMKLNNIALSFTGLERLEGGQKGIEGFFNPNPPASRSTVTSLKRSRSPSPRATPPLPTIVQGMTSTPTVVQDVAHARTVLRDATLTTPVVMSSAAPSPKKPRLPTLHTGKRKTGLDTFLAKKNGESSRSPIPPVFAPAVVVSDAGPVPVGEGGQSESQTSWTCPRCRKAFSISPDDSGNPGRSMSLTDQKQEHEDYHFALDLQNSGGQDRSGPPTSGKIERPAPKVKKKKPEGIKAFFTTKPAK